MNSLILWIIIILFLILAIILWSGRGSFLIAGYNTAGKAMQARYDKKKLGRVVGGGLGAVAVLMAAMNSPLGLKWPILQQVFMIGTLVILAVTLVLANTIAKVKNPPSEPATAAEQRGVRRQRGLALAVTLVVVLLVVIVFFYGSVTYQWGHEALQVDASGWKDIEIPYADIEAVTLQDNMVIGSKEFGFNSSRLNAGTYKNAAYGKYTIYAFTQTKTYVVVTAKGETYVLNDKTKAATQTLYEQLKKQAL